MVHRLYHREVEVAVETHGVMGYVTEFNKSFDV